MQIFFVCNKIRWKKRVRSFPLYTCNCSIVHVKLISSEDPSFWPKIKIKQWSSFNPQKHTRHSGASVKVQVSCVLSVIPPCLMTSSRKARWPYRPVHSVEKNSILISLSLLFFSFICLYIMNQHLGVYLHVVLQTPGNVVDPRCSPPYAARDRQRTVSSLMRSDRTGKCRVHIKF